MSEKRRIRRLLAAFVATGALSLALAPSAFAAEVFPVSTELSPAEVGTVDGSAQGADSSNRVSVNVLDFQGEAGETVFLSVKVNGKSIASYLPHKLGTNTSGEALVDGGNVSADVFAVELDRSLLTVEGGKMIEVQVYESRADTKHELFTVNPVYAKLGDSEPVLIGTCTEGATYTAPDSMANNGQMYRLKEGEEGSKMATSTEALYFEYEAYDASTTIDGSVRYVDMKTGKELAYYTPVKGLAYNGKSQTVKLEPISEGGILYRPVSFTNSVTLTNPGKTSVVVPVFAIGQDAVVDPYTAEIKMVDGDGNIIAKDNVFVNSASNILYTAPSTIYKTKDGVVYTYTRTSDPTATIGHGKNRPEGDLVEFKYEQQPLDAAEVEVTFNLLDGSKREGDPGRVIASPVTETVSKERSSVGPKDFEAPAGYKLAGSQDDETYIYSYGSGKVPVVNVYYLPEGYEPEGSYTVTVNYVNFFDRTTIDSETFVSSPDQVRNSDGSSPESFVSPQSFTHNGVDWVRLPGQEDAIDHNYYSFSETNDGVKYKTYTVYYRDASLQLEQEPVITNINTVFIDVPGTTTTIPGATTTGATTTAATAGTDGAATAATTAAAALRNGVAYNVADGAGFDQTAVGQDGRTAEQERIEDEGVALSDGSDLSSASGAGQVGSFRVTGWMIAAIAIIVVGLGGAIAFEVMRRRKQNDEA